MSAIEEAAPGVRREPEAKRTHRALVLTGLVVGMFLAAIEGTIVATAMPSIAARLGGFGLYSWVFSAYLLMQAITTPIFGKLSDLYGRKPTFVAGVTIFLLGSVLCGFAGSMVTLVAFRFLQGIGAGAVIPISATLVGDLYTLEERGRVQGYLASVWGVSSIAGPLAGGLIVQHASWHWIFWLNIPFALIAIALIVLFLHEGLAKQRRSIDFAGAALLLLGLSALMLALTQAGTWGAGAAGALGVVALAALAGFVRQQRRAADPMMHLELWDDRLIRLGNLAMLMAGIAMIGLITFLPTYVQGVLGRTALVAGFTLAGMSFGWPLASVLAGRLFVRLGVRRLVRLGGLATTLGAVWIALLVDRGAPLAAVGAFVMGIGFGLMNTTYLVAIQTSVPWAQRGVATSTNLLMRNLGNALGAAMLGGMLNVHLQGYLAERRLEDHVSIDSVRELVEEGRAGAGPDPAVLELLREGLAGSLHQVFWMIALCGLATLVIGWRVPDLAARAAATELPSGH